MTRIFTALFLVLTLAAAAQAATSPAPAQLPYYGQDFFASPLKGAELRDSLFKILSSAHHHVANGFDEIVQDCSTDCVRHVPVGYNRAREILLGELYLVKTSTGYGITDVYCDRVVDMSEFPKDKPAPGKVPDATIINTEHTWPQSRFVTGFPNEMEKSDLHHLFPTSAAVNSRRSSFEFGEVSHEDRSLPCPVSQLGASDDGRRIVFEPPADHRGNVARALFYFSVRYKAPIAPAEEKVLREWNRADPVDAAERARNERIFAVQGNRNPFVDYPELADQIQDF
jgi:deoxyribonuclease-1